MSVFLDTNVLLYAVSDTDIEKRDRARALLQRDDCALSMQVFNEFMAQATRPSRADRISIEQALEHVSVWRRFSVQPLDLALFDGAAGLFADGGFSFWDSMIVAAARAQGCETLYSEDMQDGRIVGGLRIVNPFR